MELRIKELCKEKGITQKDLAEKSGFSRVGLAKAISGNPTIGTLQKVADALGVEFLELFAPKDDFVAMVSLGGETKRFDSVEALAEYIRPMIEG